MILPFWLQSMPDGAAKNASMQRFYIRLAALYASEDGTLEELAARINVNYNGLKSHSISICRISDRARDGIRRLLGDDFVPPYAIEFRSTRPSNGYDL